MSERIVLAVDGGSASRSAIRWITHHVGVRAATIDIISVLDTDRHHDEELRTRMRAVADEMLVRAAVTLRTMLPSTKVTTTLREGDPAEEILSVARSAALLVIGTNRDAASRGSIMGSLPSRIASRASGVCIVVPATWIPRAGPIVVGSASDRAADAAVAFATSAAQRDSLDLVIAHAWQLPSVGFVDMPAESAAVDASIPTRQHLVLDSEVVAVRSVAPGLRVSGDLREGAAAIQLTAIAATASLLVVGRRSRPSIARMLLGSVSHDVLSAPPCPIAIVPQPQRPIEVLRESEPEFI